jgi:hypothetical protein
MLDEMTKKRFRVVDAPVAGPSLMLPLAQLSRVREVLDSNAISYWVDSFAISLDRKPAQVVINFGRKGDANRIQALLDEAG